MRVVNRSQNSQVEDVSPDGEWNTATPKGLEARHSGEGREAEHVCGSTAHCQRQELFPRPWRRGAQN